MFRVLKDGMWTLETGRKLTTGSKTDRRLQVQKQVARAAA